MPEDTAPLNITLRDEDPTDRRTALDHLNDALAPYFLALVWLISALGFLALYLKVG